MNAVSNRAGRRRCHWCTSDPLYQAYHDTEWGVPLRDSRALFELLCLEGAQAGLSWLTILRKRDGYRRAFAKFEPSRVAAFTAADVKRLVGDPGIVRHRQKIEATISNARALLALEASGVDFVDWLWAFAPRPARRARARPPTRSAESEAMSKALKKAGFRFVGPTTCYAFMQASGMVDDHDPDCFRSRRQ